MTGKQEASVVPVASGNVVAFSRILELVWGAVLSGASHWTESIGSVASSERFHISDCG